MFGFSLRLLMFLTPWHKRCSIAELKIGKILQTNNLQPGLKYNPTKLRRHDCFANWYNEAWQFSTFVQDKYYFVYLNT